MNCLAGLDFGSVQVKLAVVDPGRVHRPLLTMVRANLGQTDRTALEMLAEASAVLGTGVRLRLGVTGVSAPRFDEDGGHGAMCSINQPAAAVAAVTAAFGTVRTIIDLGGRFSTWILVRPGEHGQPAGIEDFALNGLCAAGSGIFLEQQASRLRLSAAELGALAARAERGAAIAGRCSVFAKSDMIHLQQKGTPQDEIAYGLCLALARTFVATVLEKRRVETPLAFIGGGAANPGLLKAFCSVLGIDRSEILVPADHLFCSAIGAAISAQDGPPVLLAEWLDGRAAGNESTRTLPVRHGVGHGLVRQDSRVLSEKPASRRTGDGARIPVHLGIDVGSVSTNVALVAGDLTCLDAIYVATGGRPVAALDQAFGEIGQRYGDRLEVLSVGATGSGRYLAGRLVGADLVKNEITAQLVSAAHFFPEVETVFEIGGQDAKFITVRNGLLQDFEMNKICSAGTGSFLEEQAERLGVAIVDEFSELAFRSAAPADLGSRCTVFMDGELCNAMAAGHRVEDLCAGLACAVARNYLEKVVAGRKVGATVVFQGGTSANEAVVSAFAALLGRPVLVHPYGRVSGAIGAGLLAAKAWAARGGGKSHFAGFDSCRHHSLTGFECSGCANLCRVNRIEIGGEKVHFGDVCERYSSLDNVEKRPSKQEKSQTVPDLFAARQALLAEALSEIKKSGGHGRVGLVRSSLMLEYLPFWAHLLSELNFAPVVADGTAGDGEDQGVSPSVCLPQKLAAADIRQLLSKRQVDRVLIPSVLELEPCQPGDRPHTCIYSQQLPDMIGSAFEGRLIAPQLGLACSSDLRREGSLVLADALGMSMRNVDRAWRIAMERQAAFGEARRRLGRQAVAELPGRGVVVIGKPYNLHDPRANLGLAGHLVRLGLPALPMDLMPLDRERLDDNWYMLPWLLSRHQLRALQLMSGHSRLYPIIVSSYGCGPDAFTGKHLQRSWGAKPRLFLEFDGHRGEAGLVTRLEAFADEMETHGRGAGEPGRLRQPQPRNGAGAPPGTRCLLPYTSEHVHVYAGMLRRAGCAAEILTPPDEESAKLGDQVCSGRECHPYSLLAGDLVKLVKTGQITAGDRYFLPATRLPCLLSQYGDGLRHVLEELGEQRLQIFDQHPGEAAAMFGAVGMIDLYEGLTIVDYLIVAACASRPYEHEKGSVDRWLAGSCRKVEECLAARSDRRDCLDRCVSDLGRIAVTRHERRPLVGVTGDLYTRINACGNRGLFARLEAMGCEVWPSPFFAAATDFELPQNARRWQQRGRFGKALTTRATAALLAARSRRLAETLGPELKSRCVEPAQADLQRLALSYVHDNSSHLVRAMVAKMADFARRGADGVISAIGLNCMAGTAAATAIPQIRKDHGGLPIISLVCGGTEGPSHQLLIDTFIRQVRRDRTRRKTFAG